MTAPSPMQQRVLDALRSAPLRLDLAGIADDLGITWPTLSEHLDVLAKKAHITLERRGPGRAPTVKLRGPKVAEPESIVAAAAHWPETGLIAFVPRPARHGAEAQAIFDLIGEAGSPLFLRSKYEHGFVTSAGRFVGREEGWLIAKASGQTFYDHNFEPAPWPERDTHLHSEDVWPDADTSAGHVEGVEG